MVVKYIAYLAWIIPQETHYSTRKLLIEQKDELGFLILKGILQQYRNDLDD